MVQHGQEDDFRFFQECGDTAPLRVSSAMERQNRTHLLRSRGVGCDKDASKKRRGER